MSFIQRIPGSHTGVTQVTTNRVGNETFVIPRPAAFDLVDVGPSMLAALRNFQPDWIYFGTLANSHSQCEAMLQRITAALTNSRCFYDVNLREGHWQLDLVERLSRLASIIKLNESEAEILFGLSQVPYPFSLEHFSRYWSDEYGVKMVCISHIPKRLSCSR